MDLDTPVTETSVSSSSAYDFGEGIPKNFRGQYEIMGVVTHKGRSADSGMSLICPPYTCVNNISLQLLVVGHVATLCLCHADDLRKQYTFVSLILI